MSLKIAARRAESEQVGEVYATTEYDKFKQTKGNAFFRSNKAFEKLKLSIARTGGNLSPILVFSDFTIHEGNHRLLACQENNVPLRYIFISDKFRDAQTYVEINSTPQGFRQKDYITVAANHNNKYAKIYQDYKKAFNLQDTQLLSMIQGTEVREHQLAELKVPVLDTEEITILERNMDSLIKFNAVFHEHLGVKVSNNRGMVGVLVLAQCPTFDAKKFFSKERWTTALKRLGQASLSFHVKSGNAGQQEAVKRMEELYKIVVGKSCGLEYFYESKYLKHNVHPIQWVDAKYNF